MKNTENTTAKAETTTSNNATGSYDGKYHLIKQRVRTSNTTDAFWIDAQAMLPAIQNFESARKVGSAIKPTEYTERYLMFLVNELVKSIGIKTACERVLTKCYMIEFNQQIGSLVKAEYAKLMLANPDMPVSKTDVEKLVNNSDLVKFYNKEHKFPASENADSLLNKCKREVEKANKLRIENGKPAWNETETASKVQGLYRIKLAQQAEQNELLS